LEKARKEGQGNQGKNNEKLDQAASKRILVGKRLHV